MTIGEKIKQRRTELKMSQRELAAKMGYAHHSTLARIESGKVDVSQTKIKQFAEVLETDIAYLMDWEKVQKNNDALTDIIIRMRTDEDFLSVVKILSDLDSEKLSGVKQMLSAFLK